jgi:hypothetical protein
MPWLRSEDAALKSRLDGLVVQDANAPAGGRPVDVRYRLPTDEIANLTYPVIIIEHAGIYPAQDRMHDGIQQLPYAPEGFQPFWQPGQGIDVTQSPYYSGLITPYNLDYQVTLYGRFWSAHIQPLIAELATITRLPAKQGALWVPQDSTYRTMRLLGGPEEGYGTDEDGKRLFKVVYRLRVFSELVEGIQATKAFGGTLVPVNTVDIDLSVYADTSPVDLFTPAGIQENIGIMSIGASSTVNVQN